MRHPKILTTIRTYDLALLRADLLAGITVAMVALPLSLAIAIASGADPAQGLVTAAVAGFLISALGGSRVQVGGPTGAFIVVARGFKSFGDAVKAKLAREIAGPARWPFRYAQRARIAPAAIRFAD